jgi:hypothetical protein
VALSGRGQGHFAGRWRITELRKPGPGVVRAGMVKLREDVERELVVGAGGVNIAGGLVRIAEVEEHGGLIVAVGKPAEQIDGLFIAADGLSVIAVVKMDVAEAVQRLRLTVDVGQLPVQPKGLLAAGEGVLIIAELRVAPTDGVEGVSLADPVTGGPV